VSHDVFISHEARDRAVAEAVCEAIERAGHLCWVAHRDAAVGRESNMAGVEAIGASKIFLLILSAESAESAQVRREAERAASAGLAIIPFRIEPTEPPAELDFLIGGAPRLDALQPPLGPHLDHLTAIVGRLLDGGEGAPLRPLTLPPRPLPPLPGPAPSWLPIALAGLIGLIAIAVVAAMIAR
jgi:TIR domain-containing protein